MNQFLSANRYAGRLASNSVVQYALWLNEATPEQHDRLIRWWQDEIEGTGRVPLLSCEQKPEVLRFAGGTDADLRIQWQEFLLRMIANAFDLPPMLLGLQQDVNRSTAGELADEAFQSAIVPVAKLVAEHITRDLFAKKLGWREFEFAFNDLETRDEMQEVQMQMELLKAGVLTVAEVRAMRGLEHLSPGGAAVRITIDNLDGLGALDYSDWISADGPLTVKRKLNAPSTCEGMLDLNASSLRVPLRKARVVVGREDGTVLFTGYVATEPELSYAGEGMTGAAYRLGFRAISDEWLLDRQGATSGGAGLAQNGVDALRALTSRAGTGTFPVSGAGQVRSIGVFEPRQGGNWSENAGALASSVYAAYRVIGGAVEVKPVSTVTHSLSDGDGSLQPGELQLSQIREMANDVTLSGEMEAAAYIAESFAGDGTTAFFALASTPFRGGLSSATAPPISDDFTSASLNPKVWNASDPGSHFSLTSAGLTLSGGNGLDGQTTLGAVDTVELGGSVLLEMGSVQMESASDGVLCGLYSGDISRGNCVAGYNVRQSNGTTVVAPLVNGAETGTPYTLLSGTSLRIARACALRGGAEGSADLLRHGRRCGSGLWRRSGGGAAGRGARHPGSGRLVQYPGDDSV